MTAEVYHAIVQEWEGGVTNKAEIARRTGQTRSMVQRALQKHEAGTGGRQPKSAGRDSPVGVSVKDDDPSPVLPQKPTLEQVGYPGNEKDRIIAQLRSELERVRSQMEWAVHADCERLTGGTFTLNFSDLHFHDRGFMLSSFDSLVGKTMELIDRFRPRRFFGVLNGDVIPGRGIYRNQHLDAVLPKADQQIAAGAYKFLEFDNRFNDNFPNMPREWIVTQGNHDFSQGEPTSMQFVATLRMFSVMARYVGTEWIHNCADDGEYNILFEHGYGGSSFSPTGNKMVLETLIKIIDYQGRGTRIDRVAHGHTHWKMADFKRGTIPWDTTGGLQRNDRANIGKNSRPVGWIAYVSPPGMDTILRPIEIEPSESALRKDLDDPTLEEKNRADAARCLENFTDLCRRLGILDDAKFQEK